MKSKRLALGKLMPWPELTAIIKVMKITALLTVICLQVSAGSLAQVSITGKELSLERIFTEIRKQAQVNVLVNKLDLKDTKPVTIDLRNVPVSQILDVAFRDQPLIYEIIGRNIFIYRKTDKEVNKETNKNPTPITEKPLPVRVTGRIVNQNDDPVPGATVTEKGTKNATSTLGDGTFALSVGSNSAILVISGANVDEQEHRLNGNSLALISVTMKISKLDEIQVVAYGTNTQRYQLGSVSKVTAADIQKQPISNPLASLEGVVPGLMVRQTTGLPGGQFLVQIRGQNTVRSTTSGPPPLDNPLIIINGVPFAPNNTIINTLNSLASANQGLYNNLYGGLSPLNSINPSDIESIEVLRDADATAIYGARGANGVILITTKSAKSGKTNVAFNAYTGFSRPTKTLKLMNTDQYREMRKEALANERLTPTLSNAPDLLVYDSTKYTDWEDYFLGNSATTNDVNISVSGGSSSTQFLIGGAFHRESVLLPGDFSEKKGSVNFSVTHSSADKRFTVALNGNFSHIHSTSSGIFNGLTGYTTLPNFPDPLDQNGNLVWSYNGYTLPSNPLRYIKTPYKSLTDNLITNLLLSYKIVEGLTLKSSFGYNQIGIDEISKSLRSAENPTSTRKASATFGANKIKSWIVEPQLEYQKGFGKLRLTFLIGSTFQENKGASTTISGTNYNNDDLLESLAGAGTITVNGVSNSTYRYSAGFGRFSLIHDGKYLLNLTGRRDASSRFGPDKRIGNFGSIGAGWIISEEGFMKNIKVISFAKLRGSFGTTGSDAVADFQYNPYWAPSAVSFQGSNGYSPVNLANPNFSWSVNRKLESGIELGFLGDKIFVSATWYRNRCSNQLVNYQLPAQTGFTGIIQNFPATVENQGWEFQANVSPIKTKDFSWNSIFNMTIPRNRLIAFPDIEKSTYVNQYVLGKSLSVLRLYNYLGIDKQDGLFKYSSKSGPVVLPRNEDKIVFGDLDPDFFGGWKNELRYKSVTLSFLFQYTKTLGKSYLGQVNAAYTVGERFANQPVAVLNRWQKPGDENKLQQKFTTTSSSDSRAYTAGATLQASTGGYTDASFIRLRNISVNYSLKDVARRIKFENASVFVSAQNIATITNYFGVDPETQAVYGVPPLFSAVIGVQLSF